MRSGPVGGTILIVLFAARPLLAGETTPAGPEFRVNSTTTGGQRFPSIASDAQGNFVVVWQTLSGGGVFGQRYASDGSPRGSQFDVFTAGAPGLASVASDPSGAFVVVFELSDYAGNGVFGQRFDSAGVNLGGGVIFRVNSYVTGNQERPSVAVGPTGDFVVVWSSKDQDGSSYGVFGQRIASAGTPLGGEFQVNESTTGIQYRPDVATDSQGNFVVVWTGSGPSSGDVYGRRYASSGSPLGSEFRVNTYTSNNQGDPDLTVLPSGDFVVVWGSSSSVGGILGQRYASSGVPLGTEFRVNSSTSAIQVRPAVSHDDAGGFVVTWSLQDVAMPFAAQDVVGRKFASTGVPAGVEFRVNSYTTDLQDWAEVAPISPGKFVVVWMSSFQDGSLYGIFGQRLGVDGPPVVTLNPTSVTFICGGASVSFTAGASAVPPATVQWQVSTNSGASFSDVPGATSPTLTFTATAMQHNNQYRARFTNPSGSAASSPASLTVINDTTSPTVAAPDVSTTTQTLCQ